MDSYSVSKNDFIIQCKVQQIVDELNTSLHHENTMTLHIETHANPNIIIEGVHIIKRDHNKIIVEYSENNEKKEYTFNSLFHIKKMNNMDIGI